MNLDSLVLQEYVATANNPEYNGDYDVINSKFPEFENVDPIVLQEYVLTANNPEYKNDYDVINGKFPEFFTEEKIETTNPQEIKPNQKQQSNNIELETVSEWEPKVFTNKGEVDTGHYEGLDMMDVEKVNYNKWKNIQNKKQELENNIPLQDVAEGVDFAFGLKIEEENPLFNKNVKKDFIYKPDNKDINELINKSDSTNKNKNIDPNSLEYYYGDRFISKMDYSEGGDLATLSYYDTEDLNSFNQPKKINPDDFLKPIRKERRNKKALELMNKYKGDVNSFVEDELDVSENVDENLKLFYESGNVSLEDKEYLKRLEENFKRGFIGNVTGNYFNKEQLLKLNDTYKKTGKIDEETFLRTRANAGQKAYDEYGNLIGVNFPKGEPQKPMETGQNGFNKEETTQINNLTTSLQEQAPTVETLKEKRNKEFFKLITLGNEISENSEEILDLDGGVVNNILDLTSGGGILGALMIDENAVSKEEAVARAQFLGKEGFSGNTLKKIQSNHPLAREYNSKLMDILAIDRALKLNSNLMTVTEESNLKRSINTFQNVIANAGDIKPTPTQTAEAYSNILRETGLEVDSEILQQEINQTSFGEGALDIGVNISPLLLSIAATKKMTVGFGDKLYGVKPALSYMDEIAKTLGKGKSPALQKAYKLINGAAKEIVTIGAANEFGWSMFNSEKMPLKDAVVFGMGNSVVAGISKKMFASYMPFLSKYSKTKFGVGVGVPMKLSLGGVTATSIAKANEGIQANVDYWLGNISDIEYDKKIEHLKDIQSWGQEIVAFTALGVRGEIFRDAKNRILDIDSRSQNTIDAARKLGIKEFSTEEEIISAVGTKSKELGVDKLNFAQLNDPKIKSELEAINLAAETLRAQNTIAQSKKIIESVTNDRLKTEAKIDIIAKKITSNQELDIKDVKEISKFSDTPVGNENNGYNVRTPVEALSKVLASKLGMKPGAEFNNFQKALATQAHIGKLANIQFRGESKQTQSLKNEFIGKNLDFQKVSNEYNNLKTTIDANPEIANLSKQLLKDTKSRLDAIEGEMQSLVNKNREIEKVDFESDVAFVKVEAKKLGIGFEVMDARSFINEANKGKFSNTDTAVYVPSENKIYINKDAALEKGAVSAASHELAHTLTRRAFKDASGIFTPEGIKAIDSFKNNIMSNEQRSLVEERIAQNYNPESKNFKEKSYEEYLNVFLDGVKRGEFKMNDTFNQSLSSLFKSRNKVDLGTGQGIKDFLEILNTSSKKGSLDKRLKDFYEAGEAVAEGKALIGEAVASKDAPRLTPLQEINKLIPQEIKSKEDYDEYIRDPRKGQRLVASIYTPGEVINNYIRSRQESKAEGDKIIDNVADRILNFNPESKRADGSTVGIEGFGESIFANTRFGKLDAKRDLAIEAERIKKTVSTDDKQARQIASTETKTKVEDKKAKVTPKSKITRDFPEIFTDDLKNEIDISLLKIFTGDIPGVESKEFKSFITKASRGELTKKIKKALGGSKNYEFSVKKMAEKMKETLDPRFFVRLEGQTKPENRIFTKPPRRLTKKTDIDAALLSDKVYVENLEQGVNIYEFKDFTPKQLSDYLLAPAINPKTGEKSGLRGTRKTAFAEGLVDRLTRDATPQNLKRIDKDVREIAEISKKMQVDPSTVMASKDLVRALKDIFDYAKGDIGSLTIKSKEDLIKKYSLKGEEEKVIREIDVDQFRQAIENGLEAEVILSQLIKNDFASPKSKRVLENLKIKDIARREGITEKEVTDRYIKNSWQKNSKELLESLGFENKTGRERGGAETFKVSKKYRTNLIKKLIPEGKKFSELPKDYQQMVMNTLGFGDGTRSSGAGRTNGRPLTYKEYAKELKGKEKNYSNLLEAVYGKDALIGTGKDISAFAEKFYYPSDWGSTGRKAVEGMIQNLGKQYVEGLYKKKGREQTYKEVLDANKKTLQRLYDVAKEIIVETPKNKQREALEAMMDFMFEQTNRATGGIKGLVGMESVTTKKAKSKPDSKDVHNEHLAELFSMTKDFSLMMDRYIKGEQSIKSVNKQLKRMVDDAAQALITEKRRDIKDASGAAVRDYMNNLIFLGKDAKSQVPLKEGAFGEVENMVEFIRDNSTRSFLNEIANTPYGKLTETGVIVKQQQMNKAEYQKLKNQNIEIAKQASMASKDLSRSEIRNELNKRDEAFRLANKINKPIKKARVFDFDDTLAKTESLVFYDRPNEGGKPVPRNKAIFMIGGPGSGKTNIGKGLQLGREGWKVVNQDIFIESEKAKAGLPESERGYTKEQKSLRGKIGAAGVKAAKAKLDKYTEAGEGMVIDGTGASYNATMKKVKALEEQGYEVFMVHAKTSPKTAVERNKARKERSLPTFVVERTQKAVAENIDKYKKDFGDKFMEIDTETIEYGKPLPDSFIGQVKAKVYANERGRLTAEDFAKKGQELVEQGFEMDFSDFNVVRKGERGPLFDLIKTMKEAKGERDIFILTARAPESQKAIYEFMKAMGVEIPLENITGLGKSEGKAKADWIIGKASEGYNDFFFADDAKSNVRAVRDVLEQLDVKSQVQQVLASKDLSRDFNKIIEESTGIEAEKVFSDIKAQIRGGKKKGQRFFIPPSAEDFLGLVYTTLGKGKKGEAGLKFYQENLFDPYTRAMENLSTDRVNLMADFKKLKKELDVPKDLQKTTESGFTNEQAVRVHLWNKMGETIPGLSKTDLKELNDIVEKDPKLQAFAEQILSITKGDGYSTPKESWAVGTITTDLIDVLNTKKRSKYLETWTQNKDLIYSKENLNKLEAAYGRKYREAVENSLSRMKSGSNRVQGGNRLSNQVLDYINNSTGAIMFFNTRSAILQTLSAANFVNWSFNNPFKAGKAFANQPQYWKDFTKLMNSDYLKDRRNGLKLNINESEIANAAKTSKNKAKAALNYILEKGYLPTKYADSFAIASGGATFYRNRINDLIKNEGKTEAEAEAIAMKEFRQVSEISQQSSDPSKISSQQASDLGRVVLQFANTPMQYARIQKRAVQDLVNKRGDWKTNVSKIAYYGFLQNMMFNALQQGLFALGFGDDEIDEKDEKKITKAANGMLDSSLRGLGLAGVTVGVLKNLGIDIYERSKRKTPDFVDSYKKLLEFSPAIKSKLGKFQSAAYPFDSKKRRAEVFEKGFSLDNPAYESMAKVITGTTNLPLDRLYSKVENLKGAMDEETETWQSIAMVLGWPEWQIKSDKKNTVPLRPQTERQSKRKSKFKTFKVGNKSKTKTSRKSRFK